MRRDVVAIRAACRLRHYNDDAWILGETSVCACSMGLARAGHDCNETAPMLRPPSDGSGPVVRAA